MRTETIALGAVVALTVGASATLVDEYESVSGTVEIEPAVLVDSVENRKVTLKKESGSAISTSDDMNLLNTTDGSSDTIAEDITIEKGVTDKELKNLGLSNVDEVSLSIDGSIVDSERIGGTG
nr:MAG: hypothetical protein J07AB56_05110 [Candidatus Nanosalinarum sp. J07AB56]